MIVSTAKTAAEFRDDVVAELERSRQEYLNKAKRTQIRARDRLVYEACARELAYQVSFFRALRLRCEDDAKS